MPAGERLARPLFGMHRMTWSDGPASVEFHLPHGDLIALLRMADGVIAPDIFQRDHAADAGLHFQPVRVACGALHRDLLPISLQFQNAQIGLLGGFPQLRRTLEEGRGQWEARLLREEEADIAALRKRRSE